jgi:glycosyltransferase involved in cell wall biosynthesis
MTADTLGGVWNYCLELSRSLDRFDVRIVIATMGAPMTRSQANEVAGLANVEVVESHFKLEWMRDSWDDVARAGDWLLGIESDWRPSIIHLNGYAHASLNWNAPALVVAHSCVLSWWQAVYGVGAPDEWDSYRRVVSRGLAAADAVVAPSHAMLASVRALYCEPPLARVIYNARRPGFFKAEEKRNYIFAAGRLWDPGKNFSSLDDAASSLPWKVYIAGPLGQPGSEIRLPLNFTSVGNLSAHEMRQWLAYAPVFVHPAKYEPFGLCVLEAALSGCALVLGDIPSLREIWGGAAIFVPPDENDMLRRSISLLIDCPELRRTLARLAYRRALCFSPERMAESYLRLYEEMLMRRSTSGRSACV